MRRIITLGSGPTRPSISATSWFQSTPAKGSTSLQLQRCTLKRRQAVHVSVAGTVAWLQADWVSQIR